MTTTAQYIVLFVNPADDDDLVEEVGAGATEAHAIADSRGRLHRWGLESWPVLNVRAS